MATSQKRFVLYLFDDRHMGPSDLAIARKAALTVVGQGPVGANDAAAVLSMMGINSGFTRDPEVLCLQPSTR